MKINRLFKRVIATACAASMVLTGLISDLGMVKAEAAAEHTLWVVGDSTVSAFNDSYYYPRYGYGTQIGNYLDGTYEVQNLAVSGTSSKSFTSNANYTTLTSGIQAGDTLVVGFGHNDEKSEDEARYTWPAATAGDYTETGSFEQSLYDNYIAKAQAVGAEVILCTPIVRRTATTGSWSNSQLHVTGSGDYPEAIRALGSATDVPVVDLTALTKDLYDSLGAEETLNLHAWTKNDSGSVDNTHLNIYGAKKVAWLFANAVDDTSATLASHVDLSAGEPTKANDLTSNPDYVEVEYDNDLAESMFADYVIEGEGSGDGDDVVFKGTAFGNLGGNPSTSNHILETDEYGNMHMAVKSNKGKITSDSDGIIMYWYRVPVGSSFSLSAKATVNSFTANQQVAFGLMARDDMWIDVNDSTIASDYVAAGTLGNGCNCFYRKDGKLGGMAALTTETLAVDSSYDLSIVSNSDGYTCTFGNEPAQSAGYDFALTSVDSEYVYIGMFVARAADITYSNIVLEIDGETIVDTREQEYTVTVSSDENGTAKASRTSTFEGDVVELTAKPNSGYFLKEWQVVSGDVTIEDNSFVMPAEAVEVKAIFEAYRTEWNFTSDSSLMGTENGVAIQGTTGSFKQLEIDATYQDPDTGNWAKFDSLNRSSYAQVNKGTIITIPVEGSSKVTVSAYYGANFTVDGQAAEGVTHTFICEGTDNKVTLEFTADEYLASIKVVPYAEVEAGTINFANAASTDTWDGIALTGIAGADNSHGLNVGSAGGTMVLTLKYKANIIVETCCFGSGLDTTMTASSGTVTTTAWDEKGAGSDNANTFTVAKANAGDLTLTFGGANGAWIHNITVEYIIEAGDRNIDVWDFGGLVESDTETYTNNITPAGWKATDIGNSSFPSASYTFGDLTMVPNSTDRLYTNIADLAAYNAGTYSLAQKAFDDGYTAAGAWYCNGTGGSGRRYFTISNVQAGDKIVLYAGMAHNVDSQYNFTGTGTASAQSDSVEVAASSAQKMEFVADYTGTYKIWESALSKPIYHRVMRVPYVGVSGTITSAQVDGAYTGTEHTVKFVNQTTKRETWATLNEDGTYTANLAPGYEYVAVLVGAVGYGFTVDTRSITTTDAEALTGKTDINLVIEPKETYTFSGKFTGFAEGYDVSNLVLTMLAPEDTDLLDVEAEIDENLNFTVSLEPDYDYTIQISGVNDYEVTSDLVVNKNANYTADITVGLKPMYAVTGGFIGLGEGVVPSALSFENVEDGYTYTATVTEDGYSINLRDGSYQAKATISGYSTITHVIVNGAAVSRDLMFVSTTAAPAIDWVSDIYVGYPNQANNYATVREAVAACAAMNPTSEAQRITIHIAPGTYREQVVVKTPYVSFVNDTDEEVLLTWYYGIGCEYYSIDASGYYNAERAYDKFEKKGAADWGATVFVSPSATAFRADGITFENSFNRYLTDEELEDGVAIASGSALKDERNYSLDVQSKAATERAAAMVVKADKVEFKDCAFLSSQDTLFTGNAAYNVYFKNCFIEGQTDYIFGDGNAVFDACELSWCGYSTGSLGGYITAAKPSTVNGYLFRNCVVTASDELTVEPGYFGRPWGADAKVKFLNTRLESTDLITAAGWTSMSGAAPENANFAEYNTTDMNGTAVITVGRTTGTVKDAATAATWTMESIYGDWVPAFYTAEEATVAFATAPFVTDNGDINTPYPGHTLTVGYSLGDANDANDASRIEWYRVKAGETDVLVKTSSANVDKTYKITSDDIGYQIKVVVTPITVSGNTGEAASSTVDETVRDGYEDPDASGSDVILGDGVNIFLVGDSTVRDYSSNCVWSSTARNEGSWGEFFQDFFNDEKVTVVNYANGGRSTRNFINEGILETIGEQIGEGDYLFIQFGHNDCSNGSSYLADRYVPLGEPDANGVYPVTAGTKVTTPSELEGKGYGSTCYTYDCGGTFKWYLQQYINVATEVGAIPVLVTPVSRMYYNSDGTIKAHHDSTDTTSGTQVTSNNAYVTAVKQLAEEQNVLLIDGFEITKKTFEDAYTACGGEAYGVQIMSYDTANSKQDKTHNNKLGGVIWAAAMASAVQNMDLNISYAVKAPAKVMGQTTDPLTVFSINGSSVLTAYDISSDYAERATYWEGVGQDMIDDIAEKAAELAGSDEGGDVTPGTGDGSDVNPGTNDGNDGTNDGNDGTNDGGDKPGTNDGNDKPGDGNDKPAVNTEGLKVRLVNPDAEYEYTGNAIKPAIVVTNNGEKLVAGVDYTVKYSNNVNVPTKKEPTITVTGKGNIAGSVSTTFKIVPKDIDDSDVIEGSVVVVKNSKATPILVYNNKKLGNKDFTNPDAKKKFAEDGVITITGKGNFEGTREINVKVVDKKDLKKFTVTVGKEKLTYNGEEQIPTITVADKASKAPLTEGTDYIIVYGGSTVNAGTVKFTVIGLGIYSGTVAKSYKISPLVVKDGMEVTGVDEDGYGFTSKGVTIGEDLTVTYKATGDVLTEGKDYKISYSGNKKVGTAKYTIKFQGNYKGSKAVSGTFTIVPAGLNDATDGLKIVLADQIYKGKPNTYKSKPIVDIDGVTLKASNYTVKYYKDAELTDEIVGKNKVSLGADEKYTTIYVKIVGKGNYAPANGEYATAEYKVYAKDGYKNLSKARVTFVDENGNKIKNVSYTGNELEPTVKVEYKNGKTWVEVPADQYEVSYTNNVNKGKATVVVTGTGDEYAGSKTAKISIVAKSLKDIKDLWK